MLMLPLITIRNIIHILDIHPSSSSSIRIVAMYTLQIVIIVAVAVAGFFYAVFYLSDLVGHRYQGIGESYFHVYGAFEQGAGGTQRFSRAFFGFEVSDFRV